MELKWSVPEYKDILGSLHTTMNLLKVMGQHMQDTGFSEVLIESGILGPNITEHSMAGRSKSS